MKNNMYQNRRQFIKTGMTGLIGAGMHSHPLQSDELESRKTTYKKVYRQFGQTGIKLPVISMGAGDTNNPQLLTAALDAGVVLLATSPYYGNGRNEEIIGQVIQERKRDSYMIMTSVLPEGINHREGLYTKAEDGPLLESRLDGSLKRLGLKEIDICLLPFAARRESVFFEPLLKAMENIKKKGKARFVGIATHSWEEEAIRAAVETKIYDMVMTAYNFRKQNLEAMNKAIKEAARAGLGIVAMKTMAGAYWDKERKNPINSRAALKWVLQNKNIHTAVPGVTTFDQLYQNMALMADLKMTGKEKEDLKIGRLNKKEGLYCQQCRACVAQCRYGLDIPTLMRSYMYAYGYKNLLRAKDTLASLNPTHIPCVNCAGCTVQCSMRFDVKRKVLDISRLQTVDRDLLI